MARYIASFLLILFAVLASGSASAQSIGAACSVPWQQRMAADGRSMIICRSGVWQMNAGNQTGVTEGSACSPAGAMATTASRQVMVCAAGVWTKENNKLTPEIDELLTAFSSSNVSGGPCNGANQLFSYSAEGEPLYCQDGEWLSVSWKDANPSSFAFADQTDVERNATVTSNALSLVGFTDQLTATCTGCTAIARNGVWGGTTVSGFTSGDEISIRLTSASNWTTAATATVKLGNTVSAPWSVTTRAQDTAPNPFSFTNQSGVALSSAISSNAVSLSGFDGPLTATCSGCTAIARNGTWGGTSVSGFLSGDTIAIRLSSSSNSGTSVTATATVGNTTSTAWSVSTGNPPDAPSALAPSAISGTSITWNWSTVTGATGYEWGPTTATTTAKGTSTSHTETGLVCETTYTRYARAYSGFGEGPTVTLSGTTGPCPPIASVTLSHSTINPGNSWSASVSCSGHTSASTTSSYSGACTQNGTSAAWIACGATSTGGYSTDAEFTSRGGCTQTMCVTATGPGGSSGQNCSSWYWADQTPNAFSFSNRTGIPRSTTVTSNAVTVTGFDGALTASCTTCTAIARNGVWGTTTVSGFVAGDTIAIRRTSSSSYSGTVTATVKLGTTTSGTWSITSEAEPLAYCSSATRTWGTYSCTGSISSGYTGDSVTASDSTMEGVGTATYTCSSSGTWTTSSSSCTKCTGGTGYAAYVDRYPDLAGCYVQASCRDGMCTKRGFPAGCTKAQFGSAHYNGDGNIEGRCYQ